MANIPRRIKAQFAYADGEEVDSDPAEDFNAYSWGLRADRIIGTTNQ